MPLQQQQRREDKQCDICGLHYPTEELAGKCHDWCSTHATCNIEIIKQAIESQKK